MGGRVIAGVEDQPQIGEHDVHVYQRWGEESIEICVPFLPTISIIGKPISWSDGLEGTSEQNDFIKLGNIYP
jgi:hypothetical protein